MNKTEKNQKLLSSGGIFVDIFIGFLVAACIAGIIYRCFIYDPNALDQANESYMVYFEIENAYDTYAQHLHSGDAVYDEATGLRIGTLAVHVDHTPDSAVAVSQQQTDSPLVVTGVMHSVPGEMEQGTLIIDGAYMLTPGQIVEIYTDTVSVSVRVLKIVESVE